MTKMNISGRNCATMVRAFVIGALFSSVAAAGPVPKLAQTEWAQQREQKTDDESLGVDAHENQAVLRETTAEEIEARLQRAIANLKSVDERTWKRAERRAKKHFARAASPSAALLLQRALDASQARKHAIAIQHLNDLVNLAPDFAEGWRLRGMAHLREQSIGAAISDLADAVALEPRNFETLTVLGHAFEGIGDHKRAFAAYQKALDIHPHFEAAQKGVERLRLIMQGVGI
jgi:tetratricopeptide (TPR) repeat protein